MTLASRQVVAGAGVRYEQAGRQELWYASDPRTWSGRGTFERAAAGSAERIPPISGPATTQGFRSASEGTSRSYWSSTVLTVPSVPALGSVGSSVGP